MLGFRKNIPVAVNQASPILQSEANPTSYNPYNSTIKIENPITISTEGLRSLNGNQDKAEVYILTDDGKEGTIWKKRGLGLSNEDNRGTILVTQDQYVYEMQFTGDINPCWFGAKGDYNHTTGIGTDDTLAIQAALDFAFGLPNKKKVLLCAGSYLLETIYVPYGIHLEGEIYNMTSVSHGVVLVQKSSNDVIRFRGYYTSGRYRYFGKISKFTIFGNSSSITGTGINTLDAENNSIVFQDTCFFNEIVIRNMPENGIHIRAAFPAVLDRMVLLFNKGAGIKITRTANIQGLQLSNISGDANSYLIDIDSLRSNDNIIISNLKSEKRVNPIYNNIIGQANPIRCVNSNGGTIHINGASHICSVVSSDLVNYEKPGDLVLIQNSTNHPTVTWQGVCFELKDNSVGADPKIINSGTFLEADVNYNCHQGTFNGVTFYLNSPIITKRITDSSNSTTLDVSKSTTFLVNYSTPTVISNLINGLDSQIVTLTFSNNNVSINNNSYFALSSNFTSSANSIITLLYVGGIWRELSRSNSIKGTATLVNGTVAVTNPKVTSSSTILISRNTPAGTIGHLSAPSASIVHGVSFVINSSSATENSTINWHIIN